MARQKGWQEVRDCQEGFRRGGGAFKFESTREGVGAGEIRRQAKRLRLKRLGGRFAANSRRVAKDRLGDLEGKIPAALRELVAAAEAIAEIETARLFEVHDDKDFDAYALRRFGVSGRILSRIRGLGAYLSIVLDTARRPVVYDTVHAIAVSKVPYEIRQEVVERAYALAAEEARKVMPGDLRRMTNAVLLEKSTLT